MDAVYDDDDDDDGDDIVETLLFFIHRLELNDFYGQKPTSFDPMSGSITLSSMPIIIPSSSTPINNVVTTGSDHDQSIEDDPSSSLETVERGPTFQFCIRDSVTARQDLEMAMESMQNKLSIYKISNDDDGDDDVLDKADANDATVDATTSVVSSSISKPLALFMLGSIERGNKLF